MRKKKFLGLAATAMALCIGIAPLAACKNNSTAHTTHTGGEATCTQKAVCAECGQEYGELAAHTSVSANNGVAATCTTAGKASDTVCSVCHATLTTGGTIAALGHTSVSANNGVAATCTTDGKASDTVCSVCHATLTTGETIAAGHSYSKGIEAATCTTDGVTTYTCDSCGDTYTEITSKSAGHVSADNAVWTTKSTTPDVDNPCHVTVVEVTKCAKCDNDIERTVEVHKPSYTATVTRAATCKAAGEIKYECSCGNDVYTYTAETASTPNAHTWIEATDTANATHVCSVCGLTKNEVTKTGTTATVTAAELVGENVAIAMTETSTTLQPDAELVEKMGGAEIKVATTELTSLDLDAELAEQIGNSTVYDFGLTKDGESVDFGGAKMTVSVPYTLDEGEDPTAISVLYINESGNSEYIDAVYSDGYAVFEVEHFSYYTVVRLTPEQRCAKLGSHDYQDTVVAGTCTSDGYTLRVCRRCGDHQTIAGNKATGHDYEKQVIAPTCTEKGYSIFTCSHCHETYIGEYVAKTEHAYEKKTVAPTCTASGYDEYTCPDCGKQYKDSYVSATGHSFTGGSCSVCGTKDPSVSDNFYFNLIESIDVTEGVYFELSDVTFEYITTVSSSDGGGDDKIEQYSESGASAEYKVTIDLYRFTFRIDEDGNLEAKGDGSMTMTSTQTSEGQEPTTYARNSEAKIVIKDGKIYTYSKMLSNGETDTYYNVQILNDDTQSAWIDQIENMYEKVCTDELKALVAALQDQKNSPLNGAIAAVTEYLFTKTETDAGYTFTLNTDRAKELITTLTTKSFVTVFDEVFGEGAYQDTYNWIYALPAKTVKELKTEVFVWMLKTGVSRDVLYAAVNSVVDALMPPEEGSEGFDIDALITAQDDVTVAQLIASATQTEITAASLQSMIESYGTMLSNDVPVADLVAGLAQLPLEGSVADFVKNYESVINALSEALKNGFDLSFTTDKTGGYLGFSVVLDKFEFTLDESVTGDDSLTIKLDGSLTVTPGGDFVSDVNTIVTKLENALQSLDIAEEQRLTKNGTEYTLKEIDDELYLIPDFNIDNVYRYDQNNNAVVGEYEGETCFVISLRTDDHTYRLTATGLTLSDDCTPWVEYDVDCNYAYYTYFKVYVASLSDLTDLTADGILGFEYDAASTENVFYEWTSSTTLYYNPVTGKFAGEEQHKYVLVAQKEAECKTGGEGYEKYRCTVCGDTYTRTLWKSHNTEMTHELLGATCEDGVKIIYTCTVCGEVDYSYEIYRHEILCIVTSIEDDDCACGDLYLVEFRCACGEYNEGFYVEGRCEFDYIGEEFKHCSETNRVCSHGYHEHYKETYRCAVTGCAYTYTVEYYYEPTETQCVYNYHKIITIGGEKYEFVKENVALHEYTYKWSDDGLVKTYECGYCEYVFREYTYKTITVGDDSYKVLVKYYDYDSEYGYEQVYADGDHCHYTRYELGANQERVGEGEDCTKHLNVSSVTETKDGIRTQSSVCLACDTPLGTTTYQIAKVTVAGNVHTFTRVISYLDEDGNGYVRVYNGCSYIEYEVIGGVQAGSGSYGTEHKPYIAEPDENNCKEPTCTQYGYLTICCAFCDETEHVYLHEYGHNYVATEDGDGYVCNRCGIHNQTGADGPISLESEVTDDSVIIGYNDRFDRDNLAIAIYVNNGTDNPIRLDVAYDQESWTAEAPQLMSWDELYEYYYNYYYDYYDYYGDWRTYGECGTITIDKTALQEALETLKESGVAVNDVSVSVTVSGKHMPDDEYEDGIEQSVTFSLSELFGEDNSAEENEGDLAA